MTKNLKKYLAAKERRESWNLDILAQQTIIDTGLDRYPGASAGMRKIVMDAKHNLRKAQRNQRRAVAAMEIFG